MTETITLDKLYKELKEIEKKMLTKTQMEEILTTLEILSNENTMEQIKKSEDDIKLGKIKEIKSINDL